MEGPEVCAVLQPALSPRPHAWLCTLAIAPLWLRTARLSGSQRRKPNAITRFQIVLATSKAQIMHP